MLRIVIEDDRAQQAQMPTQTQTQMQAQSQPASGGMLEPHLRQRIERRIIPRTNTSPSSSSMTSMSGSRSSSTNAGTPPAWLHQAVKGLISKAAEDAVKKP